MKLVRLAGTCLDGSDCPTVSSTARGTIAVQGSVLTAANCAPGTAAVHVPLDLLLAAARAAARGAPERPRARDSRSSTWMTASGTIAVQGPVLAGFSTPAGENIVEIPVELLLETARAAG